MKKRGFLGALGLGIIALTIGIISSCSQSTSSGTAYSYAGPGSKWAITLATDNTFTVTYAASLTASVTLTVTGTYSRLSTGFVKLTVTSVTGSNGPSVGDTAYGMEIPGFAFLLKPAGSNTNLMPMIASGSCPTSDFSANWIKMESDDSSSANNAATDWYGTFTYATATGIGTVTAKYPLTSTSPTTLGTQALTAGTCSNGLMTVGTGGSAVDIFLTSAGGALVHSGVADSAHDEFIVALPGSTISATTDLAASYAGIVFDKSAATSSSNRMFPVSVTFTAPTTSTLSGSASQITDVETGTTGSNGASLALSNLNTPSAGFLTGTLTANSTTRNVACMGKANIVSSGKNILMCIGQSPSDITKHFNVIFVSR